MLSNASVKDLMQRFTLSKYIAATLLKLSTYTWVLNCWLAVHFYIYLRQRTSADLLSTFIWLSLGRLVRSLHLYDSHVYGVWSSPVHNAHHCLITLLERMLSSCHQLENCHHSRRTVHFLCAHTICDQQSENSNYDVLYIHNHDPRISIYNRWR